jgi:hypothetical protein
MKTPANNNLKNSLTIVITTTNSPGLIKPTPNCKPTCFAEDLKHLRCSETTRAYQPDPAPVWRTKPRWKAGEHDLQHRVLTLL